MLDRALPLRQPGPYQLQAAIALAPPRAARPTGRRSPRSTAGSRALAPSPVVELNRAVAVAMAEGPERGLELIDGIDGLDGYRHLHSARADLLRRLGRGDEAADGLRPRARAGAAARRARVPGAAAGRSTILGVTVEAKLYGCQSMTGALRRVLVRAPARRGPATAGSACGWRARARRRPGSRASTRPSARCSRTAGAEVVLAESRRRRQPGRDLHLRPGARRRRGRAPAPPGQGVPPRRGGRDGARTSSAPASRSRAG